MKIISKTESRNYDVCQCENCGAEHNYDTDIKKCCICGKEICKSCGTPVDVFESGDRMVLEDDSIDFKPKRSDWYYVDGLLPSGRYYVCSDCTKTAHSIIKAYHKKVVSLIKSFNKRFDKINNDVKEELEANGAKVEM